MLRDTACKGCRFSLIVALSPSRPLPQFANRPLVLQGSEVHCCTVEHRHTKELWVQAQYVDEYDSQDAVPDVLTYLPVTLLRPSFSEVTDPLRRCAAGKYIYIYMLVV